MTDLVKTFEKEAENQTDTIGKPTNISSKRIKSEETVKF